MASAGVTAPEPLSVAVDDWVCGSDGRIADPRLVIGAEGGIANVVVHIAGSDEAPAYRAQEPPLLDQRGCVFTPHVTVVAPGEELRVRNSDAVLHTFRTVATLNRKVNKAQVRDKEDVFRFSSPEIIKVECDVHYWMTAVIVVAVDAYTAVTGADGSFEIANLEPGTYQVELWHEQLGTKTVAAVVGPDGGRLDLSWEATAP